MQVSKLKDGQCLRVPLSSLVEAPWGNVRKRERDPRKYEQLKDSVARRGVVQAITVRPNEADNTLEVLAGYGRRQACIDVGKDDIPVVVMRVDDREAMAIGLAENLQREDLSITDEITVSQHFVSLFDSDYEEAARALGWPERKVRGRLKLNDCSEAVLDALGEGRIKIGHAEVLCQFVEKLQNNTLEKILEEGWSVEYLKERANKATRLLRHAKFDTGACTQCPHNSSVQASLFDNNIGDAKCGHLPCYREKTEAWLEARKAELEQEEGRVLLAVEKPERDRNTVSAEVVGETAFTEDCLSCADRVRILKDGINADAGTVIDNQCIGIACFKKKLEARREAKATAGKASAKGSGAEKANKKDKTTKSKTGVAKLTPAVTEQARSFVRSVVGEQLLKNDSYRLALMLLAMSELTGYRLNGRTYGARKDTVAMLAAKPVSELKDEIAAAIQFGTLEAEQGAGRLEGTDVVIASAKHIEAAKQSVTSAWKPSKEWLSTYQKGAIEGFCRQRGIGFAKAYDASEGKGAFAKLMKKKKDELIEAILDFDFDWSSIAPKEVTDLVGR